MFLDRIGELLRAYGYSVVETTHDCGELGRLAQSRKRFLLVARHATKVPAFLYEPPKRTLRAVGDVLSKLPLPGDPQTGPMHRVPSLQWKTWVRLAFVEGGRDWRSLNKFRGGGKVADCLIVPEMRSGMLGVTGWKSPACTITGRGGATNGAFSVADPRFDEVAAGQFGERQRTDPAGTVLGPHTPVQGSFSNADPRGGPRSFQDIIYRANRLQGPSP